MKAETFDYSWYHYIQDGHSPFKATTWGLWSSSPPISQTLWHWSNSIQNLLECIIHSFRFVIELLHWHKVCKPGGDKLHRPPVVALIIFHGSEIILPLFTPNLISPALIERMTLMNLFEVSGLFQYSRLTIQWR